MISLLRDGTGDAEITQLLLKTWERRDDQYSEDRKRIQTFEDRKRGPNRDSSRLSSSNSHTKVEMHRVGG